jgi:hypothetical protein
MRAGTMEVARNSITQVKDAQSDLGVDVGLYKTYGQVAHSSNTINEK